MSKTTNKFSLEIRERTVRLAGTTSDDTLVDGLEKGILFGEGGNDILLGGLGQNKFVAGGNQAFSLAGCRTFVHNVGELPYAATSEGLLAEADHNNDGSPTCRTCYSRSAG